MATSKVSVTEGSGKNLATHSLTEDAVTKEVSRVNLNDSAGADILGSKTDAKSTATDTASVSAISIWKQISASVQALVTAWGAALTRDAGAADSSTLRVTIDSDQVGSDPMLTDDAAFTPATSKVLPVGFEADESSTDSVDDGDIGAARMTLDRKQIVTTQPHTTGGLSTFRSIDLDETEEDVKTSAGQVYGMWVTNTATATRFVKFYNATAANTTVGSTTPFITVGIPGNSSDDVSGLFSSAQGVAFDTAICVAATTGVADNDTGAPGANDVIINVFYK